MEDIHHFIEKYFTEYLSFCQKRNPLIDPERILHIPPLGNELEELMIYLCSRGVKPVIGGTLAVVKHLKLSSEEIKAHDFRPIHKIDLFFSNELPPPPKGWQVDKKSTALISWISPLNGCVEFLKMNNTNELGKDLESIEAGCPVIDIKTLFKMKLDSNRQRDLFDLLSLALVVGIPVDLEEELLNETQRRNLEAIKLWIKFRSKKK